MEENIEEASPTKTIGVNTRDTLLWRGRPSQLVNILPGIVLVFIGLALFIAKHQLGESSFSWEYPTFSDYLGRGISWGLVAILLLGVYKVLSIHYTKYEVTEERLVEYTGITRLFQKCETLELYNVYDYQLPAALLLALFSKGSLKLLTNDPTQQIVTIRAISKREELYHLVRDRVEVLRVAKKGYFNDPGS